MVKQEPSNLAERIRYLFEIKRYTAYQVSLETGVSQSTFSHILNGHTTKLTKNTCNILSQYFKVDPYWLQTGKGEMTTQTESDINRTGSPDELIERIRQLEMENQRLNGKLEMCEKLLQHMMGSPPEKHAEGDSVRKKSG